MDKVKEVTLVFPEGITPKLAQEIAMHAENITGYGVSQGGCKCLNPANLLFEDGPVEWDESRMEFIHSYKRN